MVLRQFLLVVIDPKQVKDLVAGTCGNVCLEHSYIRLPQHMHQICTQGRSRLLADYNKRKCFNSSVGAASASAMVHADRGSQWSILV